MKYNGKELIELSPEKWDGKSREMLVWDDISENPLEGTVLGYYPQDNIWIALVPSIGSECSWQHCAEMPKEEKEIEDLKKRKKELEFVLTCDGILNYGPIMEELKEINKILENL